MATSEIKSLPLQKLVWMGDSLDVVRLFPKAVRDEIGFALYEAQIGDKHVNAKPLRGLGPGILEVVSDHHGNTFRAGVYRTFRGQDLRLARLSKEVEARNRNSQPRTRIGAAETETSGCAGRST